MEDKPLVWLHGEVKTPPFSMEARVEAGFLPRRLQQGKMLSMPHSRPMPGVGPRCHELRIPDRDVTWRIMCRIDEDAIVLVEVFEKKTRATPQNVIAACQKRLAFTIVWSKNKWTQQNARGSKPPDFRLGRRAIFWA